MYFVQRGPSGHGGPHSVPRGPDGGGVHRLVDRGAGRGGGRQTAAGPVREGEGGEEEEGASGAEGGDGQEETGAAGRCRSPASRDGRPCHCRCFCRSVLDGGGLVVAGTAPAAEQGRSRHGGMVAFVEMERRRHGYLAAIWADLWHKSESSGSRMTFRNDLFGLTRCLLTPHSSPPCFIHYHMITPPCLAD